MVILQVSYQYKDQTSQQYKDQKLFLFLSFICYKMAISAALSIVLDFYLQRCLALNDKFWVSIVLYYKIFISFSKHSFSWALVLVPQLKLIAVWLAFYCVLLFLLGLLLD